MKTITFATTQMNLINCAEYLSTVDGVHLLVLDSSSVARKRQMIRLLENNAYSCLFSKIICRKITDNRVLDFFCTLYYTIMLVFVARFNKIDQVVSGNYYCFGSRVFYANLLKNNSKAIYVACDDGVGTIAIAQNRPNEIRELKPMMYCPNRIFNRILKQYPLFFIPKSIMFFTNYNINIERNDRVIHHNYPYLKEHLDDFKINNNIFTRKVIVLGEPLYFKDFVTKDCYAEKLKSFSATTDDDILYYAHPEETYQKWLELGKIDGYTYIDNFLPFEILAAILPADCRVATFISSVLMNIKEINAQLKPECIKFNYSEVLPKFDYNEIKLVYEHYESIGVKFYEFD